MSRALLSDAVDEANGTRRDAAAAATTAAAEAATGAAAEAAAKAAAKAAAQQAQHKGTAAAESSRVSIYRLVAI